MQVSSRVFTGIILLGLAVSTLFLSNLFVTMMIGEINRKRQESDLISYFGFTFPKMVRIFREYRRLYSGGKLHVYALISFAVAMLSLVIVAVCLNIIG